MILVEYRTKAKNSRKQRTRFFEVDDTKARTMDGAREYVKRVMGNNIEILKAIYVGTYLGDGK